jgi:hypothetical protein
MRSLLRLAACLLFACAALRAGAAETSLEKQLAALAPQRPGVVDLYVMLVAPDGEEAVFARETATVRGVLETRFDARGRVVQLVNGNRTTGTAEATIDNLAAALTGIGHVIDRDEDLVLVHITTHGSHDHFLVFRQGKRDLTWMDGPAYRKILDASGIRNRVLSISACYSGGFIKPLADANTLVVTAAEATRQSYGCGNDSVITDFSRAFYVGGLRSTYSFESAFRYAQDAIYRDERQSGYEHSNPQMYVGADIKPRLIALHKRLAAKH